MKVCPASPWPGYVLRTPAGMLIRKPDQSPYLFNTEQEARDFIQSEREK